VFESFENQSVLFAVSGALSALLFFGTLALIPVLIVRMRPDYFVAPKRASSPLRKSHAIVFWLGLTVKNVVGALLMLVGCVMLVTPGQGILTFLVGLTLTNCPGKYRLERWLVTRRSVWRAANWLRRRARRPPLRWPGDPDTEPGRRHA
jgi:hypothetical protein